MSSDLVRNLFTAPYFAITCFYFRSFLLVMGLYLSGEVRPDLVPKSFREVTMKRYEEICNVRLQLEIPKWGVATSRSLSSSRPGAT